MESAQVLSIFVFFCGSKLCIQYNDLYDYEWNLDHDLFDSETSESEEEDQSNAVVQNETDVIINDDNVNELDDDDSECSNDEDKDTSDSDVDNEEYESVED